MHSLRKEAKYNLKKNYPLYLQTGIIIALLLVITSTKIDLSMAAAEAPIMVQQELVEMEEIPQTQQIKTPPPPPQPMVPVEVPNDEIIEDQIINLDAELNLDGPMVLPPPPPREEEEEVEEEIFVVVEEYPRPIGGMAALNRKVKYPEAARRAGIEGRVFLEFLVTKEGEIENPEVVRGIHPLCDKSALKALKETKFIPGKQRGRPVPVRFSLSITFRLEN